MENIKNGSWNLAYVTLSKKNEAEVLFTNIVTVEVLTEGALRELSEDKRRVNDYFESWDIIQCVNWNVYEFIEAVVHYADEFIKIKDINDEKHHEISLNFSRLLLNVLSIFRSFLDHTDTSLSRIFGKDSQQVATWKKEISRAYNESFEYRFFYGLRNYTQHIGMPPVYYSFTANREEESATLLLEFSRDKLLSKKDVWKSSVRDEIFSLSQNIPLIPSFNTWSELFVRVSKCLLEIKYLAASESAKRILGHRRRLKIPDDSDICLVSVPIMDPKPSSMNLSMNWLPERKSKLLFDNHSIR